MSELPPSWAEIELGDAVDYGKTFKAEPEEIPDDAWLLELEDIEKDTSRLLARVTFGERRSKSTKNRFSAGDVLYGKLRPYLNKVIRADRDGFCTTEIVPLKSISAVDGGYLFHWVRHPRFRDYVTTVSHGLNMPRLGTDAGRRAPFVLAPIQEQRRIARKLDVLRAKADACRDRLDRVPQILKKFREAVLEAAVSGRLTEAWRPAHQDGLRPTASEWLNEITAKRKDRRSDGKYKAPSSPDLAHWNRDLPEGWATASVSAFTECLDYARIPVKREARKSTLRLYPYFGANGLVDMVDDFIFDGELVLVTEDETFYGREKPIAYRVSGKCWVNNHAHVLSLPNSDTADYVCFSLMHYDVIPWLTGTTGRAKLTQGVLNSLPISVPPPAELVEVVRRVRELFILAESLQKRLQTAVSAIERLTPSVLGQAFRGELVPQNPNDEPAEKLLERIRSADRASRAGQLEGRKGKHPRSAVSDSRAD